MIPMNVADKPMLYGMVPERDLNTSWFNELDGRTESAGIELGSVGLTPQSLLTPMRGDKKRRGEQGHQNVAQ